MLTASLAAKEGKKLAVISGSFIVMEIVITVLKRKLMLINVVRRDNVTFKPHHIFSSSMIP